MWEQPVHRWLVASVYHWYDSLVWRLPGVRAYERWQTRRHAGDDFYVPLTNRQDLRCHRLQGRSRVTLATVEIDQGTFNRLRSRKPS